MPLSPNLFPPAFVPEPYCRFEDMIEAAYLNLFPSPKDDTELEEVCIKGKSDIGLRRDEELRKEEQKPHSPPAPSLAGTNPLEASREEKNKRIKAVEIRHQARVKGIDGFLAGVRSGKISPTVLLSPTFRPQDFERLRQLLAMGRKILPDCLVNISHSRREQYHAATLQKLYSGTLKSFVINKDGEIIEIAKRDLWLVNRISIPAIETGLLDVGQRGTPILKHLLFDRDQVATLFPRLQSSNDGGADKVKKVLSIDLTEAFIRKNHPEFCAPEWKMSVKNAAVQEAIKTETGRPISKSTLQDAKRRIKS